MKTDLGKKIVLIILGGYIFPAYSWTLWSILFHQATLK